MADRIVTSRVSPVPSVAVVDGTWEYRSQILHTGLTRWEIAIEYRTKMGEWVEAASEGLRSPVLASREQAIECAQGVLDDLEFVPSSEVVQEREVSGE